MASEGEGTPAGQVVGGIAKPISADALRHLTSRHLRQMQSMAQPPSREMELQDRCYRLEKMLMRTMERAQQPPRIFDGAGEPDPSSAPNSILGTLNHPTPAPVKTSSYPMPRGLSQALGQIGHIPQDYSFDRDALGTIAQQMKEVAEWHKSIIEVMEYFQAQFELDIFKHNDKAKQLYERMVGLAYRELFANVVFHQKGNSIR